MHWFCSPMDDIPRQKRNSCKVTWEYIFKRKCVFRAHVTVKLLALFSIWNSMTFDQTRSAWAWKSSVLLVDVCRCRTQRCLVSVYLHLLLLPFRSINDAMKGTRDTEKSNTKMDLAIIGYSQGKVRGDGNQLNPSYRCHFPWRRIEINLKYSIRDSFNVHAIAIKRESRKCCVPFVIIRDRSKLHVPPELPDSPFKFSDFDFTFDSPSTIHQLHSCFSPAYYTIYHVFSISERRLRFSRFQPNIVSNILLDGNPLGLSNFRENKILTFIEHFFTSICWDPDSLHWRWSRF